MIVKKLGAKQILGLNVLLLVGSTAIPAIASDFSGGYVGVDAGVGRDKLTGDFSAPNKTALAGGVEAGYNWDIGNSGLLLGLDGFYDQTKKKNRFINDNITPANSGDGSFGDKTYGIDGKLGYALGKWLPYAKLGVGKIKGTGDVEGKTNGTHLGLGAEYKIADQWSLGGEVSRFAGKESDGTKATNNSLFMKLKYYFNSQLPAAAPVAAAAAYVAPEPAPAPAPAPAKVCSQNLTLPGTLFQYNKANLKDAAVIDDFGNKLHGNTYTSVKVIGYTDRLGSDAYNNRLSQSRADAVKASLTRFVPESIITAEGRGKANPVTTDCKGKSKTKALVACLAPDRRVEIEAIGGCR